MVTGDSQEEVIIFRDRHTCIIIYISLLFSAFGYPLASIFNAYAYNDGSLNAWQWSNHPGQLQVTIIIMMTMLMTGMAMMMTIMMTKSYYRKINSITGRA